MAGASGLVSSSCEQPLETQTPSIQFFPLCQASIILFYVYHDIIFGKLWTRSHPPPQTKQNKNAEIIVRILKLNSAKINNLLGSLANVLPILGLLPPQADQEALCCLLEHLPSPGSDHRPSPREFCRTMNKKVRGPWFLKSGLIPSLNSSLPGHRGGPRVYPHHMS